MKQRVWTTIIALAFFLPSIWVGGLWLEAVIIAMGIISMTEIIQMSGNKVLSFEGIMSILAMVSMLVPDSYYAIFPEQFDATLLFYFLVIMILTTSIYKPETFHFEKAGALVLGAIYIGKGYYYFLETRQINFMTLLFVLLIVWSTDTFAYFVGKKFGKHKFAPLVSPNKTIEGSIGGILGAIIVSFIIQSNFYTLDFSIIQLLIVAISLSIIGQIGDLVESSIKRHYKVKDSGNFLPGHGGLLDRFDSMLFVLPTFHFIISFMSNVRF